MSNVCKVACCFDMCSADGTVLILQAVCPLWPWRRLQTVLLPCFVCLACKACLPNAWLRG